ncbi:MAG: multicopper oxidase family protein [Candidatus Acidiferrales bacterium]
MNETRRRFLQGAALAGAGIFAEAAASGAQHEHRAEHAPRPAPRGIPAGKRGTNRGYLPVVTTDVPDLPYELDGSVKVFHLVAEPVKQEILPGKIINLWGYNGSAPGPTIQAMQGDRVRLIVENHLPEITAMHWHGLEIPIAMDGIPGISQDAIPPGGKFVYEFTLHQEGTYFYHSHMAMQEMMGLIGAFILHPQEPYAPSVDQDFAVILQEYAILPNNATPNSMNMEFNWLTFNGKSGPATTPLVVRVGDRVKIRLINLGMDHHPIHLHGNTFYVTGSEAGRQPQSAWCPGNTVLVAVAQARDIEFVASNPGDWMLHCHLPHHMMNQMSSMVGPMSSGFGMPAGRGMEEGMGIMRQGNATSPENGPSLGRGMGAGATSEQRVTNGPLSTTDMQQGMEGMQHGHAMNPEEVQASKDANSVPGFPQDAFMEGPMMAMDEDVAKPETLGLRPGWSGFMQGMMTLVRVLPPEQYDRIMELRNKQAKPMEKMPGMDSHSQE